MRSLIQTLRRSPAQSMRAGIVSFLVVLVLFTPDETAAQTVLTVREAEFRSRWEGRLLDGAEPPQYFQPDGGLDVEG